MKTGYRLGKYLVRRNNMPAKKKPITPARRAANKRNTDKRKAESNVAAKINNFENYSEMMTFIKNEAKKGIAVVNK